MNIVTSIYVKNKEEVIVMNNKIPSHANIEINVSCPNTDHEISIPENIDLLLNSKRKFCIIKLSPVDNWKHLSYLYLKGFRQFHFGNTLPVKEGGLSGPALKSHVTAGIEKCQLFAENTIIAGGGIRTMRDLKNFKKCGADHFSISTICMNPIKLGIFYIKYYILARSKFIQNS